MDEFEFYLEKIKYQRDNRIEHLVEYWELHRLDIRTLIEVDLCIPCSVLFKVLNKNKNVTTSIKIGHVFVEERVRISYILNRLPHEQATVIYR